MIFKVLKNKPYYLCLLFSLLFIIWGFLVPLQDDTTFDVNIHDTYYVILYNHLYWLCSILMFINWLFYFSIAFSNILISKKWITIQVILAVISLLGTVFPYSIFYKENPFPLFDEGAEINLIISIFAIIYLISIILFFIMIILSIFRIIKKFLSK